MLQERRNKVKIPRQLPPELAGNLRRRRSLSYCLQLKSLYYDGRIKNGTRRTSEICAFLQIKRSTWYTYLKEWKESGVCRIEKQDIVFTSYQAISKIYHIEYRPHLWKRGENTVNLEFTLIAESIRANLDKQKRTLFKRAYIRERYNEYAIHCISQKGQSAQFMNEEHFSEWFTEKIKKNKFERKAFKAYRENPNTLHKLLKQAAVYRDAGRFPDINPYLGLSVRGIARLIGKNSAFSGWAYKEVLKDLKLIKVDAVSIRVSGLPVYECVPGAYQRKHEKNFSQYSFFQRLHDSITVMAE